MVESLKESTTEQLIRKKKEGRECFETEECLKEKKSARKRKRVLEKEC